MNPYVRKINYYETDRMGVTHHSNYIRFMEEARIYFLEQINWSYARLEEEGFSSPTINVSCDYKKTTTFADVIEIEVIVKTISAAKMILGYKMTKDGEVVCTGESSHCFFGKDGNLLIIKKSMPEFWAALKEFEAKEE